VTDDGDGGGIASNPHQTRALPLFHFHDVPPLPFGNRDLYDNQLTSLEVGIFDKNTALKYLYVDAQ
jgi:hypothetical protein